LVRLQVGEAMSERYDPPPPRSLEDTPALRRGVDLHDPAVCAVAFAASEALLLEPGHDSTHRRRPDLFRLGELS